MRRLLLSITALFCSLTASAAEPPEADAVSTASAHLYPDRPFRIGLIELSDIHRLEWLKTQTVDRLKKAFAPYRIEILQMSSRALEAAIEEEAVDAFIASSGFYWRMVPYGARDVATMISADRPDPNHTSAITFITRRDNSTLNSLADLQGTVLSASYPTAFMGYRIGLAEIAAAGYDPDTFFRDVKFTTTPEINAIADKVITGEADAAFVQSCWLENQPADVRTIPRHSRPPGCRLPLSSLHGHLPQHHGGRLKECGTGRSARNRPRAPHDAS